MNFLRQADVNCITPGPAGGMAPWPDVLPVESASC